MNDETSARADRRGAIGGLVISVAGSAAAAWLGFGAIGLMTLASAGFGVGLLLGWGSAVVHEPAGWSAHRTEDNGD